CFFSLSKMETTPTRKRKKSRRSTIGSESDLQRNEQNEFEPQIASESGHSPNSSPRRKSLKVSKTPSIGTLPATNILNSSNSHANGNGLIIRKNSNPTLHNSSSTSFLHEENMESQQQQQQQQQHNISPQFGSKKQTNKNVDSLNSTSTTPLPTITVA